MAEVDAVVDRPELAAPRLLQPVGGGRAASRDQVQMCAGSACGKRIVPCGRENSWERMFFLLHFRL
ncbi:MAG: hypothetical protein ACFNY0_08755 [Selenomonas sp.]